MINTEELMFLFDTCDSRSFKIECIKHLGIRARKHEPSHIVKKPTHQSLILHVLAVATTEVLGYSTDPETVKPKIIYVESRISGGKGVEYRRRQRKLMYSVEPQDRHSLLDRRDLLRSHSEAQGHR